MTAQGVGWGHNKVLNSKLNVVVGAVHAKERLTGLNCS
jgi:hypothetical protein